MKFDFDKEVDRSNSYSEKWDKYKGQDILPMWVADTDFAAPPQVAEALKERIEHGVFGYTGAPQELRQAIVSRMQERYGWQIQPEWIVFVPGMVPSLHLACRAFVGTDQQVALPLPVYPPFINAPKAAGLESLTIPMSLKEGRWVMDFARLEQQLSERTKLLLFCNPHNPGGTIYRREELEQLAEIADKHDLIVCSDEIHCDLLLDDQPHIPFASISEQAACRSLVLMSTSKTFNVAGLGCSWAIIPDDTLRFKFQRTRKGIVPDVNLLGYFSALAALEHGQPWLDAQLDYLRANRDRLEQVIAQIPGMHLAHIEATYLAWIDISELQLDDAPAFFEQAGVGLSPGRDFGNPDFIRLNFGCTRNTLELALRRIQAAVAGLKQG